MIRTLRAFRALALASLVALFATALAQGMNHGQMRGGTTPPGAAYAPMGMGMGMMATQPVDEAGFLAHMIPHHQEAVASAQALGALTERPELLALVDAIVTTQTAEIESMQGWLDRWYPEVDRAVAYQPMMRDLGQGAAVADVERAFLEDMVHHHMMAVHNAQALLAGGFAEHAEVADLARSIVMDQVREMQLMASLLQVQYGVDVPMGMMGAMGMGATGMGSMGMGGMGMGMGATGMDSMGMGFMGATGMRGMGMGATGGMHGRGAAMAGPHQAMHGGASAATIGAAEAERLALAFVAGRGGAAEPAQVVGTSLAYEVVVRIGDAEQVLRVDARTGQVTLTVER